ncbi:MAG: SpoIIIAC/SpoIIIAD family protein [Oscillospiraceae bacterium]
MNILIIVGICLAASIICKAIQQNSPEIKTLLVICTVAVAAIKIFSDVSEISGMVRELFDKSGMDEEYLKIIFKGLGICYLTQLGSDCCKECGENAIATQVEMAGKIALLVTAMPLFKGLIAIIEGLLY